jgi:hypothetical protein
MLTINTVSFAPVTKTLKDHPDTKVTFKRATLADESTRYEMLFAEAETALMTDIAAVEIWLTLVSCDIADEQGQPVLKEGMSYEEFVCGLTAIWEHDAGLLWELHEYVREANPQWVPQSEGNE